MDYSDGDDVTDNEHLAEAIDMTREGSAQPGSAGYDEGPSPTNRDSTFLVAIEELQKISTAPAKEQEKIDRALEMLRDARHADNQRRARVMAEANEILHDVWAPPE